MELARASSRPFSRNTEHRARSLILPHTCCYRCSVVAPYLTSTTAQKSCSRNSTTPPSTLVVSLPSCDPTTPFSLQYLARTLTLTLTRVSLCRSISRHVHTCSRVSPMPTPRNFVPLVPRPPAHFVFLHSTQSRSAHRYYFHARFTNLSRPHSLTAASARTH